MNLGVVISQHQVGQKQAAKKIRRPTSLLKKSFEYIGLENESTKFGLLH